jgi:hypothetical protein
VPACAVARLDPNELDLDHIADASAAHRASALGEPRVTGVAIPFATIPF